MFHRALLLCTIILSVSIGLPTIQALAPIEILTAGNSAELDAALAYANSTTEDNILLITDNITVTQPLVNGTIISPLTIEGQGYTLTETPGNPPFAPFTVLTIPPYMPVNIMNLTFVSAPIKNSGNLMVIHAAFTEVLTFEQSIYSALTNTGDLTIMNSTFSHNWATYAGGIYNYGDFNSDTVIEDSVFSNNPGNPGGALRNISSGDWGRNNVTFNRTVFRGNGSVIRNNLGQITILNSTFSGNDGILIDNHGSTRGSVIDVYNTTFAANTPNPPSGNSMIFSSGAENLITGLRIYNSTVAGNVGGDPYLLNNYNGSLAFYSGLLANNTVTHCDPYVDMISSMTDILNCTAFNYSPTYSPDINLGTLDDNGGPTQTVALNTNSVAIDSGTDDLCANTPMNSFDQRGVPRNIDGSPTGTSLCDLGAFEAGGIIRTLQFASAESTLAATKTGPYPVTLTLDNPLPIGYAPVNIYVWVSGGTAGVGTDYALFGVKTVTINPGQQTAQVTLDLLQPASDERSITLSIANQNGPGFNGPVRLGAQTTHKINFVLPSAAAPPKNYYTTRTPMLTWTGSSIATAYEVQVSTQSLVTAPYAFTTQLSNSTTRIQTTSLENGTYYWHVRFRLPSGEWGLWSTADSFVVRVPRP